jgi:hypothetical protein
VLLLLIAGTVRVVTAAAAISAAARHGSPTTQGVVGKCRTCS